MLDNSIINPYIRVAMQSILRKGTKIARRIIFDYELIYIANGEFILNYNETDYRCMAGQFILLRPGISHSFTVTDTDLSQPHIHFDITHMLDSRQIPVCFKDLKDMEIEERKNIREDIFRKYPQKPFVVFSDQKAALETFYAIVNNPKPSSLTQKGLLIRLIDMLIEDNFPETFVDNTEFIYSIEEQVKDYLDANQGLTSNLDDIAKHFNYSKCHLEHRFKDRYGISLIAYRNNKRMQSAKIMLTTQSVSDVSNKLGFSSIYVFSRAFKNHFGVSPSDYKKAR
ncbi:MAG: AraC family transcriptional regulator [Clostridia bacterium]|nr:AraC family transcriptional regulator [Clostridia bacterium]MBQ9749457.1 AraC family transcriptional regulator [Clostridia bacterium]